MHVILPEPIMNKAYSLDLKQHKKERINIETNSAFNCTHQSQRSIKFRKSTYVKAKKREKSNEKIGKISVSAIAYPIIEIDDS